MSRPGPPGLSAKQRAETWRRWKSGHGVRDIGRVLGFDHGSIRSLLIQRGGIAPAVRKRAGWALTLAEREDISRGIATGASLRSIAARLGRAPSTVSRELHDTAGAIDIAPLEQMIEPGGRRCAPRSVYSRATGRCATSSPVNWRWIGRRNRSPVG